MSPLAEIAQLKAKYPDVMFIVDSVSSLSGVKIEFDRLGIDLLLAGTQKAFALPPGLSVFTVSQAALDRAATINDRGYYFDLHEFQKNAEKRMTPSTPSIGHIYALQSKLEDMMAEGLDARFERHANLAQMTRDWAAGNGFTLFPQAGYESQDADVCEQRSQAGWTRNRRGQAAGADEGARYFDRRRLRQNQGQDLPPLEHGRRNRGGRCSRFTACSTSRLASFRRSARRPGGAWRVPGRRLCRRESR